MMTRYGRQGLAAIGVLGALLFSGRAEAASAPIVTFTPSQIGTVNTDVVVSVDPNGTSIALFQLNFGVTPSEIWLVSLTPQSGIDSSPPSGSEAGAAVFSFSADFSSAPRTTTFTVGTIRVRGDVCGASMLMTNQFYTFDDLSELNLTDDVVAGEVVCEETPTVTVPSETPTQTATSTVPTSTATRTVTNTVPTNTPTQTRTGTVPTNTPTQTLTNTVPTRTVTRTATSTVPTNTPTATRTSTETLTPTSTRTVTQTVTRTNTATSTATVTGTPTQTEAPTFGGDADGDGIPDGPDDADEETADRDGDGIPNWRDFDPTGYFYDERDGRILSGGSISVTGPGVVVIDDGSATGQYQFTVSNSEEATYTITVTPPVGCVPSVTCLHQDPPPFDVSGAPAPCIPGGGPVCALGNGENGNTGFLMSPACTPFYLSFEIGDAGDPYIINNNIPLNCVIPPVPAPAMSERGVAIAVMAMAVVAFFALRRRLVGVGTRVCRSLISLLF